MDLNVQLDYTISPEDVSYALDWLLKMYPTRVRAWVKEAGL